MSCYPQEFLDHCSTLVFQPASANPGCDLNNDGIIDNRDLAIIAANLCGLPPPPPLPPPPNGEVETVKITLTFNRFLQLLALNDMWDINVYLRNLDITDAVAARLYGTVRIMNDEAGIAVKINDGELDSAAGTQTWSFNIPNALGYLYQGFNKFTFTLWRQDIFPVENHYYATMILEIDYPVGMKPAPPEKGEEDPDDPLGGIDWSFILDIAPLLILAFAGVFILSFLPRPRRD